MFRYPLIPVFLLLIIPHVYAESVEPLQTKRIARNNAATSTAFLGSSNQPFILNAPKVQANLTVIKTGVFNSGVIYKLPSPITVSQLAWESVTGGYVARIHIVSVQAKRLRFHLVFNQEIPDISFRIQGNLNHLPLGPIDKAFIHGNNIWLPMTKGNSADLEIFVKGSTPVDGLFFVDAINIMTAEMHSNANNKIKPKSGSASLVTEKSLGLAQEIEYDLACWADDSRYPALQVAAAATAKIHFIKGGFSFACTGTLLNDRRNSFTPWFITANHCVANQATANTLEFEWFDQATSCFGFDTDSRNASTFGGAKLLWSDKKNDASFLKLRVRPPDGVSYAGWNNRRLQVGKLVWGAHHPEGDHTMVSVGRVTDVSEKVKGSDGIVRSLNRIKYVFGGTEDGSSGSGVFTVAKGLPFWMGTLYGGPENDYTVGNYSNFNSYFPSIRRWIGNRKRR